MAALVNELTQKVIEAKGKAQAHQTTLAALESQAGQASADVNALLEKIAGPSATDEDKKRLPDLEKLAASFTDRLAAQRKLATAASESATKLEAELLTLTADRAAEVAKAGATPAGTDVTVNPPNADKDPKRGFRNHKDFLSCVMKAERFKIVDDRLKGLQATQGSDEQGVYSDPYGGYTVPHGIAPGILSIRPEDDPIAPLITKVPMTAPTVSYNARVDKDHTTSVSGGFTVTRRPETVDGTSSRTKFEQVTLTANEEFGLAFATEKIITDSPESFVAIIAAGFSDEYVNNAMKERLNGTGEGERLGVMRSGALVQVSKETNQPAGTIKKENIDKMAARSWKYNRAVWLANHNTRPQLMGLVQVVGTGGNSVPYFSWNQAGDGTLLGRPIHFTEYCETLGTAGDIILVVWSEYLEGTYETEQYAESIHVRFTAAERAFRFYRRNDGRPWWRTSLTPYKGDTLSPIVTLATRS